VRYDWEDIAGVLPEGGQYVEGVGTLVLVKESEAIVRVPAAHGSSPASAVLWMVSQFDQVGLARIAAAAANGLRERMLSAVLDG